MENCLEELNFPENQETSPNFSTLFEMYSKKIREQKN
jgi:hypothetical protein